MLLIFEIDFLYADIGPSVIFFEIRKAVLVRANQYIFL